MADSLVKLTLLEDIRSDLRERIESSSNHLFIETDAAFSGVTVKEGEVQFAEDGSIPEVTVLREHSKNRRNYRKVMEQAATIFEGSSLYLNHNPDGSVNHNVQDLCGKLSGLYVTEEVTEQGKQKVLRARKLTPIGASADTLIKTVKSASDRVGLSIEAEGLGREGKNGIFEVEKLERGFGVALVTRPGTTRNLFEGDGINENVIEDKIASDEKVEGLRKIVNAATSMLSDTIWNYGAGRELSIKDRLARCKTIAAALVEELDDFSISKTTSESEEDSMKTEDIKTLTVEQLREHAPDLVKKLTEGAPAQSSEEVRKLREQLDVQTAKISKLEEAAKAKEKVEGYRKSGQTIFEGLVKELSFPQRLITPRLNRFVAELDYTRFEKDGKLDEAAVKEFIKEELDDRQRNAAPVNPGSGTVRVHEAAPFGGSGGGGSSDKSPVASLTDDQFASAFRQ